MKEKLKSRKFWIMIMTVFGLAGMALSGEIAPSEAINKAVYIVLGYFGANGVEHIATKQ
jgi:hypothetical protein